jgi:hypothetical protein
MDDKITPEPDQNLGQIDHTQYQYYQEPKKPKMADAQYLGPALIVASSLILMVIMVRINSKISDLTEAVNGLLAHANNSADVHTINSALTALDGNDRKDFDDLNKKIDQIGSQLTLLATKKPDPVVVSKPAGMSPHAPAHHSKAKPKGRHH